jgi:hypothetical protein
MSLLSHAFTFDEGVFAESEHDPVKWDYTPVNVVEVFQNKESGTSVMLGIGNSRPYRESGSKDENTSRSSAIWENLSERGVFVFLKKKF